MLSKGSPIFDFSSTVVAEAGAEKTVNSYSKKRQKAPPTTAKPPIFAINPCLIIRVIRQDEPGEGPAIQGPQPGLDKR